jgi:hypothetical protein
VIEMDFTLALVNPSVRPNEHEKIVVHLSAAEVVDVVASNYPIARIAYFARSKIPPGFMPMNFF